MERYSVVPANDGLERYREAITTLWKNNLATVPPERFGWLYAQNPNGPALSWLAVGVRDNAVVGIGSLYPRRVQVCDALVTAGVAVDFAIDRHHRVLGPAVKIQRTIAGQSSANGFAFTYAYPNKSSKAVFAHVGYRLVGEVRHFVKLIASRRKVSSYIKYPIPAALASLLIDGYFRLLDGMRLLLRPRDVVVEITGVPDDRFDVLWERVRPRYAVIGEKSSSFLAWRYSGGTTGTFSYFCLADKDHKRLKAFLVYRIEEDVATIYDLLAEDQGTMLNSLLLEFSRGMRRQRVSFISVSYFGRDRFAQLLRRLNFIERSPKRSFFVYCDPSRDPLLFSSISSRENWSLFGGDLDLQ